MKLDAHQHFWIYSKARDLWIEDGMEILMRNFMPGDIARGMKVNETEGCIAVQSETSEAGNAFLLHLAETEPAIKGIVGWVDLCSSQITENLEYWSTFSLIRGFRHVLEGQDASFMLEPSFNKGISALAEFGFTYDLLISQEQMPGAYTLVERHDDVSFILDHLGKPRIREGGYKDWEKAIRKLASRPNLYCKLSGLVTEADLQSWKPADFKRYVDCVLEVFTPQRLVFGSDWPVCLLAATYDRVYELTQELLSDCSLNEKDDIMGKNALHFYRINNGPLVK